MEEQDDLDGSSWKCIVRYVRINSWILTTESIGVSVLYMYGDVNRSTIMRVGRVKVWYYYSGVTGN